MEKKNAGVVILLETSHRRSQNPQSITSYQHTVATIKSIPALLIKLRFFSLQNETADGTATVVCLSA